MLKANGKNAVKKGEIIFSEGEEVKQVGIVLSGKVVLQGEHVRMIRPHGSYLALNSLGSQIYNATYTALEDSVIYALPVEGESTIRNIIAKNADYRAIMVSSQFRTAVELYRIKSSLNERAQGVNEDRIPYYEEGARIPLSATKMYFSYSEEMAHIQVNEIAELVTALLEDCAEVMDYIRSLMDAMCLRSRNNLFDYICEKAHEIKEKDDIPNEVNMLLNGIADEMAFQHKELSSQTQDVPDLRMDTLKSKMEGLTSGKVPVAEERSQEEREEDIRRDVASLRGSMEQILKFAAFGDADSETLKANVDHLVNAPDRMSVEDDVKRAKKTITPLVFKLYLCCYRKIREGLLHPPKAVELFMNYGMLDERLLDEEHLRFLCSIEPEVNEGPCKVVTMME